MSRLPRLLAALRAVVLFGAAACASPSPRFAGPPVAVQAGGHAFDVYVDGSAAEAIRTDPALFPDTSLVMAAAVVATERATGCRAPPARVRGDVAIVRLTLDCP